MRFLIIALFVFLFGCAGDDGSRGPAGTPGQDGAILTKGLLPKNSCTQLLPGIWAENIHSGLVFDLYYNQYCNDAHGEYCDNIATIEGATGSVNPGQGSGTVCWIDNLQFSGIRLDNGDIEVYIVEFN